MELPEILRAIYPISDEAIDLLRPMLSPRKVNAGELIIEEGKISDDLFIVKTGVLRNYAVSDGKDFTRWFAIEGDLLASMFSFRMGLPAMSSVEALTEADLLVAPIPEIKKLIVGNFEWAVWAAQFCIDGLYALERRYTFLGIGDAYTRYLNLQKFRSTQILNNIPLQHIASYLNITPQTLSRIRKRIAKGDGPVYTGEQEKGNEN